MPEGSNQYTWKPGPTILLHWGSIQAEEATGLVLVPLR